jgi:F0F1-type ATP synthase assembly protein I
MDLHEPSPNKKAKAYNTYLKYSSLGFQLLAVIGVFGWLGYELDQFLDIRFPVFMLSFGLLAFGGMMFQVYRSINRDKS